MFVGLHSSWVVPHFVATVLEIEGAWRDMRHHVSVVNNSKGVGDTALIESSEVGITDSGLAISVNIVDLTEEFLHLQCAVDCHGSSQTVTCDDQLGCLV